MPLSIPSITTERLTLRGHDRSDLAACAALWGDPLVTRHIGGHPFTPEETWTKLLRSVGHWALLGFGYWVVQENRSGRFIGEVGFADFQRDIDPPLAGVPEIGWVLMPWAHGRGFATEAVRAALVWGDAHFRGGRTACLIDPENTASIRVAGKCGYREFARTTYKGTPGILFERTA